MILSLVLSCLFANIINWPTSWSTILQLIGMHQQKLTDTGQTVYFSFVNKESETGISSNKRVFVVIEHQSMSYLSKPDLTFPKTKQAILQTAKTTVPLSNLLKASFKLAEKKAYLRYTAQSEEGEKKEERIWIMGMESEAMVKGWQEVFDDYINRSRQGTLEKDHKEQVELMSPERLKHRLMDPFSDNMATPSPYPHSKNEPIVPIPQHIQQGHFEAGPVQTSPPSPLLHEQPPINQRSSYFDSVAPPVSALKVNPSTFKNYYRPYIDNLLSINKITIRERLFSQFQEKYHSFLSYAQNAVRDLVDHRIYLLRQRIHQEWLRYEELEDIVIEVGLVEMRNVRDGHYICDDSVIRQGRNRLKNMQFLYDAIRQDAALADAFYLPMACLVTYKGYQCIVTSKVVPSEDEAYDSHILTPQKQTSRLFQRLSHLTNIQFEAFQHEKMIKFVPRNARRDKFAIVEVGKYLPEVQEGVLVRTQLFRQIFPVGSGEKCILLGGGPEVDSQRDSFRLLLQNRVKELGNLLNKLQLCPMSSGQMSLILHHFGLNGCHLSLLSKSTSQHYIHSLLKTQSTLRVFAIIFNKKLQDDHNTPNQSCETAKVLLNLLLGTGAESTQLWKVVTLHSQLLYGLAVEKEEVSKGYLLIGLAQKLGLELITNYSGIDEVFRHQNYLETVKFHTITEQPDLTPLFLQSLEKEVEVGADREIYDQLSSLFDLSRRDLPRFIISRPSLHSKVLLLLAYFISPSDRSHSHLGAYSQLGGAQYVRIDSISTFECQRRLMHSKWLMKMEQPHDRILLSASKTREYVSHYYGQYHPFLSEVLQLLSSWSMGLCQSSQSIRYSRQSLSNMINCCGNNSHHLKLSNNHFQLGECYRACHKYDEAITHYKKAKNILELNQYQSQPQYSCLLHKMGEMYLLQGKDWQSYQMFIEAIRGYEANGLTQNWGQLVKLYSDVMRCDLSQSSKRKDIHVTVLTQIQLAQHCLGQLDLLVQHNHTCQPQHLISILKVIVQPHLALLPKSTQALLRTYLISLTDQRNATPSSLQSPSHPIEYFSQLYRSRSLQTALLSHLQHSVDLLGNLKQEKRIGHLMPHKRNPNLQAFEQFMWQLLGLLGEPFLLNVLHQ